MTQKSYNPQKQPVFILSSSFNALLRHPQILFPFSILAFIQLLILELIFFAPRYPLSGFFAPVISRLEGEVFLHYPFNFALMAKWSQALQPLIYVIFGSFFLGMMVLIIDEVNAGREIDLKAVVKSTAKVYIHLFLVTLFSAILVLVLFDFYGGGMLLARQFLSSAKVPEILGKVLGAALPYFSILIPVVVTTLLAFVVPAIVIDRKKVLSACVTNFQILWGASGFVFWIVLLPVLLYVPFLLLRSSRDAFQAYFIPEIGGMVVAASILVLLFVEALQYTAITTFYLLQKGR